MATALTIYLPGQAITPVALDTGFSGTPGVDVPANTWKVQGREMLAIKNDHGSVDIRYRIEGVGKCSLGKVHPMPYYGEGAGGLDTELLASGGTLHQIPILTIDQYRASDGFATINFYDDAEDPLDLSTVGGSVTIYCFQLLQLP
jgi:hypothetical protein